MLYFYRYLMVICSFIFFLFKYMYKIFYFKLCEVYKSSIIMIYFRIYDYIVLNLLSLNDYVYYDFINIVFV